MKKRYKKIAAVTRKIRPFFTLSLLFGAFSGCADNPPLKTLELKPVTLETAKWEGPGVQWGFWCNFYTGANGIMPCDPTPAPGQTTIGFCDYYDGGTDPFPCVVHYDLYFVGRFTYDLSQFDSVAAATLIFDVVSGSQHQNPLKSNATTLGVATQAFLDFQSGIPFDNQVDLNKGPHFEFDVSPQVHDWISHARPNFGFILAGPRLTFPDNLPNDNNSALSAYSNFKIRIVYDPKLNPRVKSSQSGQYGVF